MLADMETSDIRRRLRHALEEAKKATADRRARADAGGDRLRLVPRGHRDAGVQDGGERGERRGAPLLGVHARRGRPPRRRSGTARTYIEVWLDTALDPPQVATRVNRVRGRNVTTTEGLLRADAPIYALADEDVLAFLLANIGPLVER